MSTGNVSFYNGGGVRTMGANSIVSSTKELELTDSVRVRGSSINYNAAVEKRSNNSSAYRMDDGRGGKRQ